MSSLSTLLVQLFQVVLLKLNYESDNFKLKSYESKDGESESFKSKSYESKGILIFFPPFFNEYCFQGGESPVLLAPVALPPLGAACLPLRVLGAWGGPRVLCSSVS